MFKIIKKIRNKFLYGNKSDSESYIKYLKNRGMIIGGGTVIYSPMDTTIDETRPWLIEIGDNVKITRGVTILTHGYDWSVLKVKYGDILGSAGKTTIGNNVFIGMNSTILKGVTVGNNVIIGANSLINKDIPNNVVVAGNPAKIICSIDNYYKKRCSVQLDEAVDMTIEYYVTYHRWPKKNDLREFVFLFESRNESINYDYVFKEIGSLNSNYDETYNKFMKTKGKFSSYDEFIDYCKKIYKGD